MACYDDFDGAYFTIQALRLYHDVEDMEIIVIDNNPTSPHGERLRSFAPRACVKYIPVTDRVSSWVKYDSILHASGDVVVGMDCHVLLIPGAISFLREWWNQNQGCRDLLTGPVVYDELKKGSLYLKPEWNKHDFGVWSELTSYGENQPTEVPMQGMGFWSIWRTCWPGIPKNIRGFGAEEWCIAERIRAHGGRVISHPAIGWNHRFAWPKRTFPLTLDDKITNYYRGWLSVYKNINHPRMQEMTNHWKTQILPEKVDNIIKQVLSEGCF